MLTYEQLTEIQASAGRGAALADQKIPGWVDAVNPLTLNMRSMEDCILGQSMSGGGFGFFARMTYEEKLYRLGITPAAQYHYGFAINGGFEETGDYRAAWEVLQQAWLYEMATRDDAWIVPTTPVPVTDERPLVLA